MTNRELLNTPWRLLPKADRQRLFLLRVEGTALPCPACKQPCSAFEAAGVTIDGYDFGRTRYDSACPRCGAGLEQVVPLFSIGPLWTWQLKDDWLQQQLQKAKAFDRRRQGRQDPGAA